MIIDNQTSESGKKPQEAGFVIISSSEMQDKIIEHLSALGYRYCSYESLTEFFKSPDARKNWSGLLVCLRSKMKMSESDKIFLLGIEEFYPVAIVKIQSDPQEFLCFSYNPNIGNGLSAFIDYCLAIPPRMMRTQQRKRLHLNLILSPFDSNQSLNVAAHEEKTFTVNASSGGFFIATTVEYHVGEIIDISIPLLGKNVPIKAEVSWVKPWGETKKSIPGIGVAIKKIQDLQQDIYERLLILADKETE